jgi:hypothetical protein
MTNATRIAALKADLNFAREMVKSWEDYLDWDAANPWDGKSPQSVPYHHIPDSYRRKMERPNADYRGIYRKMIADFKKKIATNEEYINSVEVR